MGVLSLVVMLGAMLNITYELSWTDQDLEGWGWWGVPDPGHTSLKQICNACWALYSHRVRELVRPVAGNNMVGIPKRRGRAAFDLDSKIH